ncbi:ZYBA0S04-08042g1_1 [Zygosaccharomyces bailii CLIB 213]|uniref:ZYBA0S04-08042g1_1 n=1 Tax=Zygosaccharomyces bailii (strain CLIB 213 / ATCC 58445 / CBS 680 / BCRC 21525 / NBRC 1098 / NCYC 1416 / NRRL Y-2227) TaxID=1333698 RepID=A0A8J2T608_ZYGB2|nr:ZYBA0S04-08042g1_1 [Zygosaccharomyces bailii CLIB 213]
MQSSKVLNLMLPKRATPRVGSLIKPSSFRAVRPFYTKNSGLRENSKDNTPVNPTSEEDLASRPDANATTSTDNYEYKRVVRDAADKGFKATWLNALAERKRQLAQGKVIDSYSYSHVNSTDVVDKTRKDSFAFVVLPFRDDPIVADFYVNAAGRLRMGQLFQDLDSLASKIAYKHTSPVEPMIVTASVDRIYLLQNLNSIADVNVILSGSVIYTGRSSMEISISARALRRDLPKEITEENLLDDDLFMTASFTFVARNPETHKSMAINRLLPLNEKEWMDFRRAESRMAAKKLKAVSMDLEKNPPTKSESAIIHQLWAASKELAQVHNKPSNVLFMKDTNKKSTMFMQPQYRNRHSYMIFGGYLMRQTFELAYCCAASFSHAFPRFVSLDSLTFNTPVPVGTILDMDATVVYTEHLHVPNSKPKIAALTDAAIDGNTIFHFQPTPINQLSLHKGDFLSKPGTLIQVKVDTSVQEFASEDSRKSGSFIYSFYAPRDMDEKHIGKPGYATVVPESYSEMIEYIQGRRRAIETANYAKSLKELHIA